LTFNLNLSPETERLLREKAAQKGLALDSFLRQLVERETQAAEGDLRQSAAVLMQPAEIERLLDEFSDDLPSLRPLAADWSRADLYADHD